MSVVADGHPLWFESPDVALRPAIEAFGCALLVPALDRGRQLVLPAEHPVCPQWLGNLAEMLAVFEEWWSYPRLLPQAATAGPAAGGARSTALCFSGGVDSFFTLLCSPRPIDLLVMVHGFDVALRDAPRFARCEAMLRVVAEAVGARPVVLRTNLRQHPALKRVSWDRAHGGPLAAVGHLLRDCVGTLRISSPSHLTRSEALGSHWRIDSLWSSSGLRVEHFGEPATRAQKLRRIADHPLVQRHLRVCWEHLNGRLNCSRCVKCLHTMLILASLGVLERFPGFDARPGWADRLDHAPLATGRLGAFEALAVSGELGSRELAAVRRFVARVRSAPGRA